MVSVYDCSFVRYPELCSPEVLAFVPIVRRAIVRGATRTHHFRVRRGRDRRDLRTGAAPQRPARRDPARRTFHRYGRGDAGRGGGAARRAGGTSSRSGRSNRGRTSRTSSPCSGRSRRRTLISVSSSWVRTARPGPTSMPRSDASTPTSRRCVLLPGPVTDAGRRALLDGAAMLAYPSIYEGFGFPVLEAMTVGLPVVAACAGSIPRWRVMPRLLVEPTDETQLADAITQLLTDDATRRELIVRGATVYANTRGRTPPWPSRAVIAAWRKRRPAHARRVPRRTAAATRAGRHRPLRAGTAGPPAGRGCRADRVRSRRASPQRAGASPWIDLGRPSGSVRYELWHRTRHPVVRLDVDVFHAPSLAVPPVRGAPLAVTVHDIAFVRYPWNTTRRGVAFHQRGFDIAWREASLVLAPSAFTRVELIREGFEPEGVVLAPLGVNRPVPRDPDEIDVTVERVGVRRAVPADGGDPRAAQGPPDHRRSAAAAPHAPTRPRAHRGRSAGLG